MAAAALVMNEIEQSSNIVSRLDNAHLEPKVALWMNTPEYGEGRLVLASPELDRTELLKSYERIARALGATTSLLNPPILLLRMKDPFIKALRSVFGKAADVHGMRLGGQLIGDKFIEDAYVFRIK